uniref:NADH dehydrogenase subunit 4 n=1 Tax=Cyrtorhinus lividipennis TaxID=1032904 RepID=UPI00211592DB|nr:NADH dehydrogenase subunit 4 [Cyrtorhinus lividipennis]USH90824.1 NADH dehydrogenase subunit 4 [Cyrtorhinus lividipennis]
MMKMMFYMFMMILFLPFFNWYFIFFCLFMMFFIFMNIMSFNIYYCMLGGFMGGDLLSLSLIFLSIWIISLMLLASGFIYKNNLFMNEFLIMNMFLLFFLFLSFSTYNLFMYYFYFECSLIPTVFLIFGWGSQPERLISGYYLLFYTLFFSLPLLLGIFYINSLCFSLFYFLICVDYNLYLYMSMYMAFMVKMPMVFVHFWLPKAHVEAPVSGSMILAGVLLKLGGYGIIRVLLFLSDFSLNYFYICLSFLGMVMIGIMTMFQVDMKSLIAYSSVSHMGLVICGLMNLNYFGLVGSLLMMIGHGLCSSGMFCLANIMYERSGSRSLFMNKGSLIFMPSMSMLWFLFIMNNMSSPPSLNFFSEVFIIIGIMSWCSLSFLFLMFSSFISCLYSIYLYSSVNHGFIHSSMNSMSGGLFSEYLLLFMHLIPLNFVFLKLDIFSLFV